MTPQKVSVNQAAEVMGLSPNEVRYCMRTKKFDPPIGQVRKSRNGKTYRYDVYKNKVMAYVGITEWPEEEEKQ